MRSFRLAAAAGLAVPLLASPQASAQTTQITAPTAGSPQIRNEPGMAVRLAGRYRFYASYVSQDLANAGGFVTGSAPTAAGPVYASVDTGKVDFMDYGRLWFGMDGMAANGLRYGAQLEIRMSDGSGARGSGRGTLQYRRMYGYVATPTLGQIRVGSGQVRATELMYTGHMQGNIASGLWDGDFPAAIIGSAGNVNSFWYSGSNGNTMTAISYLSPQFFGFDAGVSYAPSDGNFGGDTSCGTPTVANGGATCDRLTETDLDSATATRLRNIFDAMLRYRGSFGPVGLVVSGGAVGAGSIGATGTAQSYQNVLVGIIGTQVSFAGFTVGGLVSGGKANYASTSRTNQSLGFSNPASGATTSYGNGAPLRPLPSDGNNDTLFLWQIGATYTVGPVTVGVAYHEVSYEGSTAASSNARDRGLGIGGSYAVAPGMNLYAEYLYGRRAENGVNLQTGQLGTTNNKTTANVFGLGVAFNW